MESQIVSEQRLSSGPVQYVPVQNGMYMPMVVVYATQAMDPAQQSMFPTGPSKDQMQELQQMQQYIQQQMQQHWSQASATADTTTESPGNTLGPQLTSNTYARPPIPSAAVASPGFPGFPQAGTLPPGVVFSAVAMPGAPPPGSGPYAGQMPQMLMPLAGFPPPQPSAPSPALSAHAATTSSPERQTSSGSETCGCASAGTENESSGCSSTPAPDSLRHFGAVINSADKSGASGLPDAESKDGRKNFSFGTSSQASDLGMKLHRISSDEATLTEPSLILTTLHRASPSSLEPSTTIVSPIANKRDPDETEDEYESDVQEGTSTEADVKTGMQTGQAGSLCLTSLGVGTAAGSITRVSWSDHSPIPGVVQPLMVGDSTTSSGSSSGTTSAIVHNAKMVYRLPKTRTDRNAPNDGSMNKVTLNNMRVTTSASWLDSPIRPGRKSLGCWTCKVRRKKCDGTKPSCSTCESLGLNCDGYSTERPAFMREGELNEKYRAELSERIRKHRLGRSWH